jgi:hypothetical protein
MVTATRTTSDASAFAHLLDTVLALPATSPIRSSLVLHELDDLYGLLSIFEGQIETLEYLPVPSEGDATPVPIKLRMGHQQLLRYLLLWIRQLAHDKGGPLSNYELISLMKEDFSLF